MLACYNVVVIRKHFILMGVLNMKIIPGLTIKEMAEQKQSEYTDKIVAAKLDNTLTDLQNEVNDARNIEFVTLDSTYGWQVYRRSVLFLLFTAVNELYPEAEVAAKFTVNKGLFCELNQAGTELDAAKVKKIADRMHKIVAENRPIVKKVYSRDEAVQLFKTVKQIEKANLIDGLKRPLASIYHCGTYFDYLYGAMMGETGDLGLFALDYENPGMLLRTPDIDTLGKVRQKLEQPKLNHILSEAKNWAEILHCQYIPDLNRANRNGHIGDIIRISEALQEKNIAQIADHVASFQDKLRMVLIAGPSSSGKTSFAQRLRVQMMVNGLNPISISLDDYFCNRKDTPLTPKGEYDYESLGALDTKLFNQNMLDLMAGREVILPKYNFITGLREWQETPLTIASNQPIIVEGIHGLNEKLSEKIPRESKYKIYISALMQLNVDAHNRIPTTYARLVRRLVRDSQFRGAHAIKTLKQWADVRAGEEKNIFPYQEDADVMFNSALIYELGVLKKYAEPLLKAVSMAVPEHVLASQILGILQYVDAIDDEDDIPNNSILREFIGKSVFFK